MTKRICARCGECFDMDRAISEYNVLTNSNPSYEDAGFDLLPLCCGCAVKQRLSVIREELDNF